MGACCECSLVHIILVKGVGVIDSKEVNSVTPFFLNDVTVPYFIKIRYSHHTPPKEQTHGPAYISFPGPHSSLVLCHYTIHREIAITLCKPHLNIIAFSGQREHHLIETWSAAQFQEVSATQLGYSWHPSAAASILTQDSHGSQPRREDNSFRRPYHAKNRMSIFHRKSCCLIREQINLQLGLNERVAECFPLSHVLLSSSQRLCMEK